MRKKSFSSKGHPAIEQSGASFASSARFDSHCVGNVLHYVSKAHVLVQQKTGDSDPVCGCAHAVGIVQDLGRVTVIVFSAQGNLMLLC